MRMLVEMPSPPAASPIQWSSRVVGISTPMAITAPGTAYPSPTVRFTTAATRLRDRRAA